MDFGSATLRPKCSIKRPKTMEQSEIIEADKRQKLHKRSGAIMRPRVDSGASSRTAPSWKESLKVFGTANAPEESIPPRVR